MTTLLFAARRWTGSVAPRASTCAVQPTPTPRPNGDVSRVAASSAGSITCVSPELKAVPAATHSSWMSGMPLGMVSASPVDVDAGSTDATWRGSRPSHAPDAASTKSVAGATSKVSATSGTRCRIITARCVCA